MIALSCYDKDFFKWTQSQVKLMKVGKFKDLDIDHIIEEIESLGISDKRSLRSHLVVLLSHLLKKEYQPKGQGNSESWTSSIRNANLAISGLLKDSPSLKNELKKIYAQSYEMAKEFAADETGLLICRFPKHPVWNLEEIIYALKKR